MLKIWVFFFCQGGLRVSIQLTKRAFHDTAVICRWGCKRTAIQQQIEYFEHTQLIAHVI